jgi:hypothetical protein
VAKREGESKLTDDSKVFLEPMTNEYATTIHQETYLFVGHLERHEGPTACHWIQIIG